MAFKHCQKTDEMLISEMDIHKFFYSSQHATLKETFTAKYNGVLNGAL